jgi:hypothetical protein
LEKPALTQINSDKSTDRTDLVRVRDLVGYFYKCVKTILLYPPTNPLPAEFRARLHEKLVAYLSEFGPLNLQVRGDQFVYEGETVHEEAGGEDNFIATLTRDGIQKLSFLPGLEAAELSKFLDIVKKVINERSEDDDLVTLFWEASFTSIRYEAIAELDSVDYEAVERQLFAANPAHDSTDAVNYASVVLEEQDADPGQSGGAEPPASTPERVHIESTDVSRILDDLVHLSDDISQVDHYLREATQFDPASSTLGIIFEILIGENEIPEFRESCNLLDGFYDRVIEQADFHSALRIYNGLRELEASERPQSPARAQRLLESCQRTIDKLRVTQLSTALNAHPGCDMAACRTLLGSLPGEILPHMVNMLGELEHFPARSMVCDILAERGASRVDLIGNGIFDKRWYVVRNVAAILGNIGGSRACQYLEKAVRHADARVRREVVEALTRMDPVDSNHLLRTALCDAQIDLRLLALRALAHRKDSKSVEEIEARIRDKKFLRLEPTEQKEWLSALAQIAGDEALPTFQKLIGGLMFFDRAERMRLQTLATLALGSSSGPRTLEYLDRLTHHKDTRVRDAAVRAMNRIQIDGTGI